MGNAHRDILSIRLARASFPFEAKVLPMIPVISARKTIIIHPMMYLSAIVRYEIRGMNVEIAKL